MFALQLKDYSHLYQESLVYQQVKKPQIKSPNEVLVRVLAAGVNPIEAKIAAGNMLAIGSKRTIPAILGSDFAGIIEEIGSNVKEFEIGDQVYGSLRSGQHGSFAQYTLVDITQASIAKKPSNISFEQAASVGIAFLTAYRGIAEFGYLENEKARKEKKTILVIGASGGVGSFAVQIAKTINPDNTVIGICSERNTLFVQSLGVDKVVNYNNNTYQSFINQDKEYIDIIFDCIGGDNYYQQLGPLLKEKGVYSTAVGPVQHIGFESLDAMDLNEMKTKMNQNKLNGKHEYAYVGSLPHDKFRTIVAPLFEKSSMKSVVKEGNVIPLNQGHVAFERLVTHRVVGKIVLRMD